MRLYNQVLKVDKKSFINTTSLSLIIYLKHKIIINSKLVKSRKFTIFKSNYTEKSNILKKNLVENENVKLILINNNKFVT